MKFNILKKIKIGMLKYFLSIPITDLIKDSIMFLSLIALSFILAKQGLKQGHSSELCLIILGTLLSAIVTIFIDKVKIIQSNYNEIYNTIAVCTNIFDFSREIFLEFICNPFKDELCRNGSDIIYVSPITSTKFLDEKELKRYKQFINNTSEETLLKYLDEIKTRKLIERLKGKLNWFQSTEQTFLALRNGIPQAIVTIFIQFSSLLLQLINTGEYKWQDPQIRSMLVEILQLFISVHCELLIKLQQLIKMQKLLINLLSAKK